MFGTAQELGGCCIQGNQASNPIRLGSHRSLMWGLHDMEVANGEGHGRTSFMADKSQNAFLEDMVSQILRLPPAPPQMQLISIPEC